MARVGNDVKFYERSNIGCADMAGKIDDKNAKEEKQIVLLSLKRSHNNRKYVVECCCIEDMLLSVVA